MTEMHRSIWFVLASAAALGLLLWMLPPLGIFSDRFDARTWRDTESLETRCVRGRMWSDLSRRHLTHDMYSLEVIRLLGQPKTIEKASVMDFRASGSALCYVYDLGRCGTAFLGPKQGELCFNIASKLVAWRKGPAP